MLSRRLSAVSLTAARLRSSFSSALIWFCLARMMSLASARRSASVFVFDTMCDIPCLLLAPSAKIDRYVFGRGTWAIFDTCADAPCPSEIGCSARASLPPAMSFALGNNKAPVLETTLKRPERFQCLNVIGKFVADRVADRPVLDRPQKQCHRVVLGQGTTRAATDRELRAAIEDVSHILEPPPGCSCARKRGPDLGEDEVVVVTDVAAIDVNEADAHEVVVREPLDRHPWCP